MTDFDRITLLTMKFVNGTISSAEQEELDLWLNASEKNRRRFETRIREDATIEGLALLKEGDEAREADRSKIEYADREEAKVIPLRKSNWRVYTAAAAVLLLIVGGLVFMVARRPASTGTQVAAVSKTDLPPGSNRAILTLADHSSIVLDSAKNGRIASQGSTKVEKQAAGLLAYVNTAASGPVTFNSVTTPPGGQYTLILADGTKVWLDAASTLRFPTAFPGNDRTVELTGQAYLEVAKDPLKPFRVKVNDLTVAVLGTHFNVMAYPGEPVKTTLLEGSVRVSNKGQQVLLIPGQQAQFGDSRLKVIDVADLDEAVAWKNGLFQFNDADIETVMASLSRWYGVEVKYEGDKKPYRLSAVIRKDNYASDVLAALSSSGYHFKIAGKTIIVLP